MADAPPTFTVDGRELTIQPGRTVIQIAHDAGIEIPHYCYHPALPIAGNCRICMVEVEGWPKPQIACKLAPAPGMVVKTQSELAVDARKATMEFLLVNHPLDCPICDQAGECHLQDYSYQLGRGESRSTTPKTHLPKNVPFGSRIVYDAERCIKCTLCVRFCDEITKTHELAMASRSDHEIVVMTSKGEFDTRYAMNIIDLCPVGALTSRDFRFQSRLWFMDFKPSVCTHCARGCNVVMGARSGRFLRMEPRENQAVNRWWMCDEGRLAYEHVNSPTRLAVPRVRDAGGAWRETTWEDAIRAAAKALAQEGGDVLLDGAATLEEMHVFQEMAQAIGGTARFAGPVLDDGDDFLITGEKAANAMGAGLLGIERAGAPAPAAVLVVERDRNVGPDLCGATGARVVFATDEEHVPDSARVAFPYGSWAERDGVVVNVDGIPQRLRSLASAGPGGLLSAVDLAEEILLEMDRGYDAAGSEGVLARVQALPAFSAIELPGAEGAGRTVGSAT
jgi:NADH-quinone oxidoreductase subunit G